MAECAVRMITSAISSEIEDRAFRITCAAIGSIVVVLMPRPPE